MEPVYKNWMELFGNWITVMFEVGKETGGETFIQRLEEELYQEGLQHGTRLRSRLEVKEPDCTAIGNILDTVDESLGNYYDGYVENSPTGFEKHITACPVAGILSRAPEICVRLVAASGQGLATGINPKATFVIDRFITKGDETCHYRVETGQSPS